MTASRADPGDVAWNLVLPSPSAAIVRAGFRQLHLGVTPRALSIRFRSFANDPSHTSEFVVEKRGLVGT